MKLVLGVFLTIMLTVLSKNVMSQSLVSNDSIDVFWYEYMNSRREKIQAEDIVTSYKEDFFRLWLNEVVVEVWCDKNKLGGRLIHWVEEYVPYEEEATDRYFVIKDDLDSLACASILSVMNKYEIRQMPSSQYIKNWKNGLDGIEYIIEDKVNWKYKFKNYWTPSAQKDVHEAEVLEEFIDELVLVINEKERSNYFHMSIPFKSWMNGGATITSKIMTYGDIMRMKQERNRYRKQKKLQLPVK
ncbi:hypothetical protein [Hymenobacter perfusus]|uniref:Uncharacterized protein n=1 Tax=Hymenobacter perfusus TaxID=1236770 RepID=A0A3R9UZQ7_9BACT|nr:hypothetical protein [Hymenobacter perfusus]RSK43606.1 hypothetical protein EI293_12030 [Hymenobacter perfusus]